MESKCYTCEFYDSEFDERINEEYEWCEKGHSGLKAFPFVNEPKCYTQKKVITYDSFVE